MVRLSLEHGNCALSARAYGSFAALMSSALREYEDAYRFAKLGVDLAHKLDETSMLSGVYFLWAMFASHWIKPVDESVELYQQAVRFGLQSGDHVHAGYSVARRFSHLQVRGMPLAELREEGDAALEMLHRISDAANREFLQPRLELIDWLRGERRHGNTLGTDELDEAAHDGRDPSARQSLVRGRLVHGADDPALPRRGFRGSARVRRDRGGSAAVLRGFRHARRARDVLRARDGRLYPEPSRSSAPSYDAELARFATQMRRWVALCPRTIEHMQLLVEAECARLRGARIERPTSTTARSRPRARNGLPQHRGARGRARGALLARRRQARFARIYLDKALDATRPGAPTGKAPISGRSTGPRGTPRRHP